MLNNLRSTTTYFAVNTLFFTNPLSPSGTNALTNSYTDWADPIAGTQNSITVPETMDNPGTALSHFNNNLLVFHVKSLWTVRGTTPANYTLYQLSEEVGCLDSRSVVPTDHGVYFMSHRGLFVTTGTTVTDVSGAVRNDLQVALSAFRQNVQAGVGGSITAALLANGDLAVSIQVSVSGVVYTTIWSGVFKPSTGSWYRYTTYLHGNSDTNPQVGSDGYANAAPLGFLVNDRANV